jgi:hypothetical protein
MANTLTMKTAILHYTEKDKFVAESPGKHSIVTGFAAEDETAPSPME